MIEEGDPVRGQVRFSNQQAFQFPGCGPNVNVPMRPKQGSWGGQRGTVRQGRVARPITGKVMSTKPGNQGAQSGTVRQGRVARPIKGKVPMSSKPGNQ